MDFSHFRLLAGSARTSRSRKRSDLAHGSFRAGESARSQPQSENAQTTQTNSTALAVTDLNHLPGQAGSVSH